MAGPQYSQGYAPQSALTLSRQRSFIGDIFAGALYGDFARDLRVPGAVTQIVLAFIPLIGSICAIRDLIADLRHHDHVGAVLNIFALAPIIGGFSKTLEVLRAFAHVGHAVQVSRRQRERRVAKQRMVS
jgi:hypothetical protein